MEVNTNFHEVLFNRTKIIRAADISTKVPEFSDQPHRVCVLLKDPASTEKQEMIRKIMTACQLQPEDYMLSAACPWKTMRAGKEPEVLLLFGVTEKELELSLRFPLHRRCTFDHRVWIKSLDIQEVMDRKDLKNDLWKNALKPFFLG